MIAVEDWLHDLDDAVASVLVAGVTRFDADLVDEIVGLAEVARGWGLSGATARLGGLADALREVGASGRAARAPGAARAVDAVQEVIAWSRMFRAELDLMQVAARLRPATPVGAKQTCSRRVRPIGFELVGERLTVVCVDLADGEPAVLVDVLAEVDHEAPLEHPVISRLFQDSVDLRAVLGSVVELVDHPPSGTDSRRFAPVASTRPRLRGPKAVTLPRLSLDAGPRAGAGPGAATIRVVAQEDRVGLRTEAGVPFLSAPSATLRTALRKLMVREGRSDVALEVVLARRANHWAVLAATDPVDGVTVYPAHDPSVFGVSVQALVGRAVAEGPGPVASWWRAAASLVGPTPWTLAPLLQDTAGDPLRLGLAGRFAGIDATPAAATLDRLAMGDARDAAAALWLAGEDGSGGSSSLERLRAQRQGPVPDGDLPEIVRRALQLGATQEGRTFLEAHVSALARAVRQGADLPHPVDLVLFGEVVRGFRGDTDRCAVRGLGLPRHRVWRAVIEALHVGAGREGADALLLAASAGLERWVVG